METKHTAGPWEWTTGDPQLRNSGIYSIKGGRIADVLTNNHHDAQLIAAAPELLAACKAAILCPALNMDALEEADCAAIDALLAAVGKAAGQLQQS